MKYGNPGVFPISESFSLGIPEWCFFSRVKVVSSSSSIQFLTASHALDRCSVSWLLWLEKLIVEGGTVESIDLYG
jgi:hypothetical protein